MLLDGCQLSNGTEYSKTIWQFWDQTEIENGHFVRIVVLVLNSSI